MEGLLNLGRAERERDTHRAEGGGGGGGRRLGTSLSTSGITILTPTSTSTGSSFLTEISSTSTTSTTRPSNGSSSSSISSSSNTISTISTTSPPKPPGITEVTETFPTTTASTIAITTPQDCLKALQTTPSLCTLTVALAYLTSNPSIIHTPTAISSQLTSALLEHTVPTFWTSFKKRDDPNKLAILECLRGVVGIGGIVGKLRNICAQKERERKDVEVEELMEVLGGVLARRTVVWDVWKGLDGESGGGDVGVGTDGNKTEIVGRRVQGRNAKRDAAWKEFVALIAGGKVVSAVARAVEVLGKGQEEKQEEQESVVEPENGKQAVAKADEPSEADGRNKLWVADAAVYARWFATGVSVMGGKLLGKDVISENDAEDGWKGLRMMFWRSFGLGKVYWDGIVDTLTTELILTPSQPRWDILEKLLHPSSTHDKSRFLHALLKVISAKYLDPAPGHNPDWWKTDKDNVGHLAAVIAGVMRLEKAFLDIAVEWVTSASAAGGGIGVQRALLAAVEEVRPVELMRVLEGCMKNFGDKLWIAHTPIQVQEANVQAILLCAGYVSRNSTGALKKVVQTSVYLNSISNRLSSVSARARFLGMVVGEAMSGLTDDKKLRLDFKMEELNTEEAIWWKGLVNVIDKATSIHGLKRFEGGIWKSTGSGGGNNRVIDISQVKPGMDEDELVVTVVGGDSEDGSDSEDDDDGEFKPYPKPDSDPEDSDDDPTLVNRNKEAPPVYIRDLLRLLRDHDSYDRQLTGLTHAAMLIRRKAAFGTELKDHVYELAICLAGMGDKFDMEMFQEMRTQALIALVVAEPVRMGQWMIEGFFDGEYSIGQRAVLLTVVGLAARELAGLEDGDEMLPLSGASGKGRLGGVGAAGGGDGGGGRKDGKELFPSKFLPGKLHDLYSRGLQQQQQRKALPGSGGGGGGGPGSTITKSMRRIDLVANSLEREMIQPMAAQAADTLSGPNILKVRTFSSRMEVEKRRGKPVANKLGKVVGEAFFYPLTARWWMKLKEFGPSSPQFTPYLLSLTLKTLTLILHACGPSSPLLPQLTSEFWTLLLSLRTTTAPVVVEAILFALLTILELNIAFGEEGRRRLVVENGKALVETAGWVEAVFERAPGEGVVGGLGVGGAMGGGKLGGDDREGEEGRVRRLAAAVLLRTKEVMEEYQRRLLGEMMAME